MMQILQRVFSGERRPLMIHESLKRRSTRSPTVSDLTKSIEANQVKRKKDSRGLIYYDYDLMKYSRLFFFPSVYGGSSIPDFFIKKTANKVKEEQDFTTLNML